MRLPGSLILCVLLWTETFAVDGPQAVTQEIKVEVCRIEPHGARVEVSRRVLWEVATPEGSEQAVLSDWKTLAIEYIRLPSPEELTR